MMHARLPVTGFISASLFFTGVTYASTLPYGAIVGIEALGISNSTYALLLMAGSIVSAGASVALGWLSDKIGDRRLLVIACALMGALGYGLIYFLRTPLAYIIAYAAIMPFGGALFSQTFSFARTFYNLRHPDRAEFMISVLRTIFALAWVVVPPVAGWIAATASAFDVYGIASLAYLACAVIFFSMLPDERTSLAPAARASGGVAAEPAHGIETPMLIGIVGVILIKIAIALHVTTTPLAIINSFGGTLADVGLYAGLAALLEVPCMLAWGAATRRFPKHGLIIASTLIYAAYLLLLNGAGSVADVLWLQPLNAVATAALMSIPISYMQEAIKGRVGLSTSLLDVTHVVAGISAAGLFGLLTAGGSYPLVFAVGAGLCVAGAGTMFVGHFVIGRRFAAQ